MKYKEQKRLIAEYFINSQKTRDDFLYGAELEYFIVDNKSNRAISYYQKNGIKDLLTTLIEFGFKPILENSDLVGAVGPDLTITLEPGAQFEISLDPDKTLNSLEKKYLNFLQIIEPILKQRNQQFYSAGYQPVTKIEDIPFIPKKRYRYMAEFLSSKGSMALNMMKGTASIHVAVDYCSENDFAAKMLLASKLTPVFSAVYDNSAFFEGKKYENHCLRTEIWNNCDNSRCGIIPQVFLPDFGYEKYAEYLLELIPIYISDQEDLIIYDKPFKAIFDPQGDADKQLNHIFSICFPDVRARKYIELRMTDSLPYPLNFAFIELVYEIFYNKSIFESTADLLNEINYYDIISAKNSIVKSGVEAKLGSKKIITIFREIVNMTGYKNSKNFAWNRIIAEKGKIPGELL